MVKLLHNLVQKGTVLHHCQCTNGNFYLKWFRQYPFFFKPLFKCCVPVFACNNICFIIILTLSLIFRKRKQFEFPTSFQYGNSIQLMSLIVRNIFWFLGIFLMIGAMKHHAKFNAQGNANFGVGKIPKGEYSRLCLFAWFWQVFRYAL